MLITPPVSYILIFIDITLIFVLVIQYFRLIKPCADEDNSFLRPFWISEIIGLLFIWISSRFLMFILEIDTMRRFFEFFYLVAHLPIVAVTLFNYISCAVNAGRLRKNQEAIKLVTIVIVNAVIAVLEVVLCFAWIFYVFP